MNCSTIWAKVSPDGRLEARLRCKLLDCRYSSRVLEADFRCSNDQRLAVVPVHLSPQDVEVVGGGRALGQLEIDVLAAEVVELAADCVVSL